MENIKINREHKDRLFRLLFGSEKNRTNLLSLYNAINNTNYTEVDDMEIMTMQDCIYMRMKNDVSVLLHQVLALYEQQSTWNCNMPLRGFLYFSHLYEKYVEKQKLNIYGSKLLKLPTPQYIVFYNGIEMKPDEVKLRLSDAFENPCATGEFEWTATVKNINYGHNAEVFDVCLTEYDEETVMNALKEDSREEGLKEGLKKGRTEGMQDIIAIYNWLKRAGRAEEAEAIMQPENDSLRSRIQREYESVANL